MNLIVHTNVYYKSDAVVRIVNVAQAAFYIKMGLYPIDMYVGYDDKLVFLFDKEKAAPAFDKWVLREH